MANRAKGLKSRGKVGSSGVRGRLATFIGAVAVVVIAVSAWVVYWPPRSSNEGSEKKGNTSNGRGVAPQSLLLPLPGLRAGRHLNTAANVPFIGTQRCVTCHEGEHRSFLHTPHSKALGKMGDADEPPDGAFVHARSTLAYSVRHVGDEFQHHVELHDADGTLLLERDFPIQYHIGSGNHSRSFLLADGPFLFESPLTWYRARNDWGLSPGYDRPLPQGFDRMVDHGCVVCHAGRVETQDDNRFRTTIVEGTIGCESCHGPGALHAERWTDRPRPTTPVEEDLTIVNPARLTRDEFEQICSFCHLRGASTIIVRGRRLTDFRPGLPLSDFRVDYFTESGDDDMKVTGHVEQMRRSKCYVSSKEMTCITCHDPHVRAAEEDRVAHFRQKCVDCHGEHCGLDLADRKSRQADDDCVACHMPRGDTDIPHFAFTHHRVGIHDPSRKAASAKTSSPPARLIASTSLEHLADADQLRCLGLAYVEYSERQATAADGQFCRDTARQFLRQAYEREIRDASSLATLAGLEMERGRRDEAMRLARAAIEQPNAESGGHQNARFVLANAYLELGELEKAEQEMALVVKQRYRSEDWLVLAQIQERRGDANGALASLQAAEKMNPFRPDVQHLLAITYGRAGDRAQADLHRKLERRLTGRLRDRP